MAKKQVTSESINVHLNLDEHKKHSYLYRSNDSNAALQSVYVAKTAFPDGPPAAINVTITPA